MLPRLFMEINAPLPSEVKPSAVTPPAVVMINPTPRSSSPATPPLRATDLEPNNPVSKKICSPAVIVTVESGPVKVTPFSPIVPPATTAPKISISLVPSILIALPAKLLFTLAVVWM